MNQQKRIKYVPPTPSTNMLRLAYFRVGLTKKAYTGGHLDSLLSEYLPCVLRPMIASYLKPYEQCYFSFLPSMNVRKEASKLEDTTNILQFMEDALDDYNPEACSIFLSCIRLDMTLDFDFKRMDDILIRYSMECAQLQDRTHRSAVCIS